MSASDAIGSAAVLSFGLWWLVFPGSVIRFYALFDRGHVTLPRSRGVRLAGALWLAIAGAIVWSTVRR
jgi:hypothetical protein